MGIGFVILIHLVALFFLSLTIAISGSIITFFFGKKEKRKQRIFFVLVAPFIGFYTFYFLWLLGSITISEIKNVDEGLGDHWYIPLSEECQLSFNDTYGGYIDHNNQTIVSDVIEIQQEGFQLFGKTADNEYFGYNIKNSNLKTFKSKEDLILQYPDFNLKLLDSMTFYSERRNDIAGSLFMLVLIVSIAMSVVFVYLTRKLILGYLNFT